MSNTRQKRAYISALNRGKINASTTNDDMLLALQKEVSELFQAKENGDLDYFYDRLDLLMKSRNKEITSVTELTKENDALFLKTYKGIIGGTKTDELADIVILCHTFAHLLDIDLEQAISMKMKYNELRPDNK